MKFLSGSFAISFILNDLLWYFEELKILSLGEKLSDKLRGRPFNKTQYIDKKGIPYQSYSDGTKQYNPLFVATLALDQAELFPNPKAEQHFALLADWLVEHSVSDGDSLRLPYDFAYQKFDMQPPWYSALTQAEAITVFSIRFGQTQDPVWKERIEQLINSIFPPSPLTLCLSEHATWFMEYPSHAAPFALSGHCTSLLNFHHANQILPNPRLQNLFDRGYNALIKKLPVFDHHGFTLYSENGEIVGRLYHQKHINKLKQLNHIRPHPVLQKYHQRWQAKDRLPVFLQHLQNPRPKRIVAYLSTFSVLWLLSYFCLRLFGKRGS